MKIIESWLTHYSVGESGITTIKTKHQLFLSSDCVHGDISFYGYVEREYKDSIGYWSYRYAWDDINRKDIMAKDIEMSLFLAYVDFVDELKLAQ